MADWRRILDTQPDLAVRWIRFAAERGFRSAQLVLGQMHLDGHGVIRDPALAYGWFVKAAAIGSLDARNMVGRCHELGWGVPVDHVAALSHYRRAAARGHGWARYNVGCLLLYGSTERNHAEAFRCFVDASASDQADARAKALGLLGRCHEEGWGTAVDRAEAERCYARAVTAGDCWSALNLAMIQAEQGELEVAARLAETAVALATPNCLAAILQLLERRREPAFEVARARALSWLSKLSTAHVPTEHLGQRNIALSDFVIPASGRVLAMVLAWTVFWQRAGRGGWRTVRLVVGGIRPTKVRDGQQHE